MSEKEIITVEAQFKKDCKVINLNKEYPEYTGNEQYALISELTEKEIISMYSEQIIKYIPFLVLPKEFGEARSTYLKNEDKYRKRKIRTESIFGIDEKTEICHREFQVDDILTVIIKESEALSEKQRLFKGIQNLTDIQRERLIMHCVQGMTEREIAKELGKGKTTIHESIESALNYLRKFMLSPDQKG